MREHLVIVGGGQAAAQAAQSARLAGFEGKLSLFAEEPFLPYQRPPLSKKYLAGEVEAERLFLKPEDFYQSREIDVVRGEKIESVDLAARTASGSSIGTVEFSHLLLATGSEPRRLAVAGSELAGIHYLRSIADVEAIRQDFEPGKRLLVVGAGYIGLEVAAVAASAGLQVTVVETGSRVMARSVSAEMSAFYTDRHRSAGVDIRLDCALTGFSGDQQLQAATTATGESLPCDIAVVGIGIVPRTELAAQAGLAIDNGIAVDAQGKTAVPGVFAAGDCTSHPHPWVGQRVRLESVQNAIEQGKAVASAICGGNDEFNAVPWFWSDQYDLKLQIAGLSLGYDSTVIRGKPDDGSFSVFYLQRGRVIAVDSVNDPRVFILAKQHLGNKPAWPADVLADTNSDLAALAAKDT